MARRFCFVVFMLLSFGIVSTAAQSQDGRKAIIVLDASGSMWGQIDGKSKIEIAREVIRDIVSDWDPAIQLGLTAYGHRRKGDCGDIENIVPVGTVDVTGFLNIVDSIKPKGKTPLSQSVLLAAEALKYTEDAATVILVSDGKETCDIDPCALGEELEATGVDFTTHVIGFGIKDDERAQLQCLAENTGGRFLSADNAGELREALDEAVEQVKAKAPAPPPDPEPAVKPGLKVRAVQVDGGGTITDGIGFWIYDAARYESGDRNQITYSSNSEPFFELPPGMYVVRATHGAAENTVPIALPKDKFVDLEIVIGSGDLQVTSVLKEGGEPVARDLGNWVYKADPGADGKRERVTYSSNASPKFALPSGRYYVWVDHGDAGAGAEVAVRPGELTEYVMVLDAGYVRLTPLLSEGGDVIRNDFSTYVFEAEAYGNGNRDHLSYSSNAAPQFALNAGRYILVSRHGTARRELEVDIVAGETADLTVVLNAGYLKLTPMLSPNGPAVEKDLGTYIYDAAAYRAGGADHLNYTSSVPPAFTLAEGKYVVAAYHGEAKAIAEVEIAAGQTTATDLDLNAGYLDVTVTDNGAPPQGSMWFRVDAGTPGGGDSYEEVTYVARPKERVALNVGHYRVRVRLNNGREAVATADVVAGQVTSLVIDVP